MGTIRRQSIQSTLLFTAGIGLAFFLRLVVFPKYLTTDELGLLTVLLDSANLFAAFIPLGGQRILVRYLPYFERKTRGYESFPSVVIGLSAIGCVIFMMLFALFYDPIRDYYSQKAPLLSKVVFLIVPLTLSRVMYTMSAFYALSQKRNVFSNFLSEILIRILTAGIVMIYAHSFFSVTGLSILYVGIYFFTAAWMLSYSLKNKKLRFSVFKKPNLKSEVNRPVVIYGLLSAVTTGTTVITKNIDSIMITSLASLSSAGIYSIPFFIGMLIEVPKRAVSQITAPFIAESLATNDTVKIKSLYQKTALNQLIIGSITLLCVWVNIDYVFDIIPNGETYAAGKYVVLIIGISKIIDMATGSNREIIQNSPYYKTNLYLMLFLGIATIGLNILLIPKLGIEGAAITQVIIILILNVVNSVIIKLKYNIIPFTLKTLYVPVFITVVYMLVKVLPTTDFSVLNILTNSAVAVITFAVLLLISKTSEDVNILFKQVVGRIKK
ncbi:polysaccharide biosynthesis C-terminal domain-containing protein [Owenweeksia hongkongensis]|uniref:polysaccharide biosynthesis C-terminal domain-containing protein n=1 Tax=Owenweeksia hongkongensis TaxID=253245 RepID=UPI003A912043